MYEVMIKTSFSAAHRLRNYKGKCEKLHGHNWGVEVVVKSNKLRLNGLLIDFKDLKKITHRILNKVDHSNLNEIAPFDRISPTAENIAKWLYQKISREINSATIKLSMVNVEETEGSRASYYEE